MRNNSLITFIRCICVLVLALTVSATSAASSGLDLAQQRKAYLEAARHLDQGRISKWLKIRPDLKSYPLFPYLRLKEIRATQSQFSNKEISQIVSELQIPIPSSFANWWLKRLRHHGDWELVIRHYADSSNTKTRCLAAHAMIQLKKQDSSNPASASLEQAMHKLWLVNRSQPEQCDIVFKYGFDTGIIDDRLIFERMLLTKLRNDGRLTDYLAGLLKSKQYQRWGKHLNAVHRHPEKNIRKNFSKWSESKQGHGVINHGMVRVARADVGDAAKLWQELRKIDSAAIKTMSQIERTIALRLAWAQHQDSFDWLRNLPADVHDRESLRLMATSALATESWKQVMQTVDLMPIKEASRSQWRYWKARALYETGDEELANPIWLDLSSEYSYYGFLAADQLGLPYSIHQPVPSIHLNHSADVAMLEPAILRIREWLVMNKPYSARRELKRLKAARRDDADFWYHTAIQFHLWGWHDGAIQSSYRTDRARLQMNVTHPSPYAHIVRRESLRHGIPEPWIYSIMRQESNFIRDIRSGRGATGLMQLMHSTARMTANKSGLKKPSVGDLQRAEVNIRLGVAYFKQLLDQADYKTIQAIAGYNAGPRRAKKWQNSFRASDPAIWVETIVFDETRNYVKNILVNFVVYEQIHNSQSARVRDYLQLPDIQHASSSE
ncbi:MAG: transglycosylase SLT domain-containing protein [Acidiferrobacterales bacterium]|nr:transglycosylase SLT domain-containing protein [Acidiferrobacterales bacterium]